MLHTFSHLLIRQLANECGYSTASMKERIYSTFLSHSGKNEIMNGILIYTASSDCDGSLGGLISAAQNTDKLHDILENMLTKAAWCSGDPLCISSTEQGFDSLNYSACHDCVLLPETSCEFRNVLLDRVSIVGRPEEPQLGLMGGVLYSIAESDEYTQDDTIPYEPSITLTEKRHQLSGDYSDWHDAASLFDDNIIQCIITSGVPLADSYDAELMVDDRYVNALLLWENRKILLSENYVEGIATAFDAAGWVCLYTFDLTVASLQRAFGGLDNGKDDTIGSR